MYRTFMTSKIHQARVTEANLQYIGSITIDENLLEAVGLMENEQVHVVNNNNGERIETYVIKGERGSGVICLNGAAARRFQRGDSVIIMSYGQLSEEEWPTHKPKVIFLNEANEIVGRLNQSEKAGTFV